MQTGEFPVEICLVVESAVFFAWYLYPVCPICGTDDASDIIDEKVFAKNLVETLHELDNFIETAIIKRRPVKISALQEAVEQNYPVWAIRELVMNAVMHRNYDSNAPIKFYQYSDRIDIINPGGLYGNATPSNFPYVNDYRNPILAEAMKVYGYVNKFNRGIAKVQEELSANGNGLAVFSLDTDTVFEVKVAKAMYALRQVDDELPEVNVNLTGTNGDLSGTNMGIEADVQDKGRNIEASEIYCYKTWLGFSPVYQR